MQRARQTSESIELSALLALSGGLMDAYSYLGRGKVFANAQTGNMLLLGVNIGGLGTPVASLASLISFKLYSHAEHARPGAFMRCFLAVNLGLLAVLLAFAYLL